MSYSESRYLGENGDISTVRKMSPPRREIAASSTDLHHLAIQDATDGTFTLCWADMGPGTPSADTHFPRSLSESFGILSGKASLFGGERWATRSLGHFLPVLADGLHVVRNDSDEMLSMLLVFSPGAPREKYSDQVAEYARRGRKELSAGKTRHDSFFTEPEQPALTPPPPRSQAGMEEAQP